MATKCKNINETNFKVILLQEKIKDLWEKGYSAKQIAIRCNRSQASISNFMKKLNISAKQKIREKEIEIIKSFSTQVEAAEKLCVTKPAISLKIKRFKQMGLM